jgi:hypothetical protein
LLLSILVGVALASRSPGLAGAQGMKQIARIAVKDGMIHEGFAFDDAGAKLAYVDTDAQGIGRLHVGPPRGKKMSIDITSFTPAPERILFLGGHWFVIANEGVRRAAVVSPGGRIKTEIGPFDDCFISNVRSKAFVTVTNKGDKPAGQAYDIAAYRPEGSLIARNQITIARDGTLAGSEGLVFVAFTGGYLQALVKKPGRYNRKTDVRGGTEIAVLDVLSGKAGPGKSLPDIPRFLGFAQKRAEKPGLETFLRPDDGGDGLELVGPGEKLRPLALPTKFSLYEGPSLQQQISGGRLYFSLTVDPLNPDQVAAQKKGARLLHLFEVNTGAAKATLLGQVPLGETQAYSWAAGAGKVAVLKRTQASGGNEILIFAK